VKDVEWKTYAFYGIFVDRSNRDACFRPNGWTHVEDLEVEGFEANHDFGVARVVHNPHDSVKLVVCQLSPSAEEVADSIEGIHRGFYYRSNAAAVFGDAWPEDSTTDPESTTVYMLNVRGA